MSPLKVRKLTNCNKIAFAVQNVWAFASLSQFYIVK